MTKLNLQRICTKSGKEFIIEIEKLVNGSPYFAATLSDRWTEEGCDTINLPNETNDEYFAMLIFYLRTSILAVTDPTLFVKFQMFASFYLVDLSMHQFVAFAVGGRLVLMQLCLKLSRMDVKIMQWCLVLRALV